MPAPSATLWAEQLWRELRLSLRRLAATPVFTIFAVWVPRDWCRHDDGVLCVGLRRHLARRRSSGPRPRLLCPGVVVGSSQLDVRRRAR